jgi:hypothetical protein
MEWAEGPGTDGDDAPDAEAADAAAPDVAPEAAQRQELLRGLAESGHLAASMAPTAIRQAARRAARQSQPRFSTRCSAFGPQRKPSTAQQPGREGSGR